MVYSEGLTKGNSVKELFTAEWAGIGNSSGGELRGDYHPGPVAAAGVELLKHGWSWSFGKGTPNRSHSNCTHAGSEVVRNKYPKSISVLLQISPKASPLAKSI